VLAVAAVAGVAAGAGGRLSVWSHVELVFELRGELARVDSSAVPLEWLHESDGGGRLRRRRWGRTRGR